MEQQIQLLLTWLLGRALILPHGTMVPIQEHAISNRIENGKQKRLSDYCIYDVDKSRIPQWAFCMFCDGFILCLAT